MNVRNLLTLNAVLVALLSLTMLLSPATFLETNGLEVTQYTINLMRVFGAVTIGAAVTSWLLRNEPPSRAQRAFMIGAGINYAVFALVNVVNITGTPDLETNIGWVYFGLNDLLAAAFFYFSFKITD
jgi:hypothetical protein